MSLKFISEKISNTKIGRGKAVLRRIASGAKSARGKCTAVSECTARCAKVTGTFIHKCMAMQTHTRAFIHGFNILVICTVLQKSMAGRADLSALISLSLAFLPTPLTSSLSKTSLLAHIPSN